jgi:hypothetical protein
MMLHPMHRHGHFFPVLNAQGEFSPLKHTVDVAPMTTTVIECAADEFGIPIALTAFRSAIPPKANNLPQTNLCRWGEYPMAPEQRSALS